MRNCSIYNWDICDYGFFINSDDTVRFSVIDDGYKVNGHNIRNGWHHLVGCRRGDDIYLYVDGEYQGTSNVSGSTTESTDFYIGRDSMLSRFFNGSIDEVIFWDVELDARQVAFLYAEGSRDVVVVSSTRSHWCIRYVSLSTRCL